MMIGHGGGVKIREANEYTRRRELANQTLELEMK